LRGFARPDAAALMVLVEGIAAAAPFRRMVTPGGRQMSAAMTNCGEAGWVTDKTGYRYLPADPTTGRPWPAMPPVFPALFRTRA
jgi:DNA oxidative demethylase